MNKDTLVIDNKEHKAGHLLVLKLLMVVLVGWAQASHATSSKDTAFSEGMSPERLERISAYMEEAVKRKDMVGGVGLILRNGKPVFFESWGMADRERGLKMNIDSIFRIYSMTKPVTSVLLMMLHEEGLFLLSDPVSKYLPEFERMTVALSVASTDFGTNERTGRLLPSPDPLLEGRTKSAVRPPRIYELLTHTAGLGYGFYLDNEVERLYSEDNVFNASSSSEFVEKVTSRPLQDDPGTRWAYSVAVDIQGRLIEVLTGQSLADVMSNRLFTPLGMHDTSFLVPETKVDRLVQIYMPKGIGTGRYETLLSSKEKALVPGGELNNAPYLGSGTGFLSGGGGLVSTANDYARFCQMMLNGGELDGVRLLSPKTVELITSNHIEGLPGFSRQGYGFGFGFAVRISQSKTEGVGSLGEYNWGGAAGTDFWIDPEEQLIGIFMVQSLPHLTNLAEKFKILAYQALVD